ncbi:MAG: HAD-IA family hydrolase [Rhodopila sp.]
MMAHRTRTFAAAIFDVDGVLLDSPHEQAWRDALPGFADPARFTTALYQAHVAGKPRLKGALAALRALGVPDAEEHAEAYAERKQHLLQAPTDHVAAAPYPDGLRLLEALAALRWPLAAASSSKNANTMMQEVSLPSGQPLPEAFTANVCGREVSRGKPDPTLFLLAAFELGVPPPQCLVIEDAPSGIAAAVAAGMGAIGVARHADRLELQAAGAHLVVANLDDVAVDELGAGRLRRRVARPELSAWTT